MASRLFDRFSNVVARNAGRPASFAVALLLIVAWALGGPAFGFSETWQLVVNTGTTIITFLMVFVLQHSQNRDGEAVQAKLDELILVISKADNRLIGAEHLSGHELRALRHLIEEKVARNSETGRINAEVAERAPVSAVDPKSQPYKDAR